MLRSQVFCREGHRCLTIADAIDVLVNEAGFGATDTATVHIGHLQLPCGTIVGLGMVVFEQPASTKTFYVKMATATGFTAIVARANQREHFAIEQLDEACIRESGQVTLRDGTLVRGVEVVPAKLPYELSELDQKIIHATLSEIPGAHQRCYRDLLEGLPAEHRGILPPLLVLDFSTFRDESNRPCLRVPSPKVIARNFAKLFPTLDVPSATKITDTLATAGIRLTRHRRRSASQNG